MRIRGRKPPADSSVSLSPSSLSSSSSSSSESSSITAAHSLVSSQDSSNSCPYSLFATASHRCHGLDLLVKAIHQVTAGSVIGVPYIQRRVTIRRRRRRLGLEFDAFVFDELFERKKEKIGKKVNNIDNNNNKKKKKKKITTTTKKKNGKNLMGLPSRVEVLQPWGKGSDLADEMGL